MADQAEVSKAVAYSLTGVADVAQCAKVVAYVVVSPSSGGAGGSVDGQAYVRGILVRSVNPRG